MQTMRCLRCDSFLFLGGDTCPRCGGEAVPFSGPKPPPARRDPAEAAAEARGDEPPKARRAATS